MKRFKLMGLCLVAVFALAAAAAANASAGVPTWSECAKAPKVGKTYPTGEFSNKECTTKAAGGKYLLQEGLGKGKGFKGSSGPAVLHVKTWLGNGTNIECTKSKSSGTPVLPNKVKDVEVTFEKCVALGTKVCASAGAKKGDIVLKGMKGEFGYLEEGEPPVVGQKLESEAGGYTAVIGSFECEGLRVTVTGGVIGVQSKDVNVIDKEFETVDTATESIGEHEYKGNKYKPLVNLLGWADEAAEIATEVEEDEKGELPPPQEKIERDILKVIACGEFIERTIGAECTPEVYAGLDQTTVSKGEALMLKTS
jgi:hypothetical protein